MIDNCRHGWEMLLRRCLIAILMNWSNVSPNFTSFLLIFIYNSLIAYHLWPITQRRVKSQKRVSIYIRGPIPNQNHLPRNVVVTSFFLISFTFFILSTLIFCYSVILLYLLYFYIYFFYFCFRFFFVSYSIRNHFILICSNNNK